MSKELLDELKKILKEDYGLDLSSDEIFKIASDLVAYFDLLAKINFSTK